GPGRERPADHRVRARHPDRLRPGPALGRVGALRRRPVLVHRARPRLAQHLDGRRRRAAHLLGHPADLRRAARPVPPGPRRRCPLMEQISLLLDGFGAALTPYNLLFVLIGAVLGTAVGVLPGLGSSMAVALLLPITFALDPTAAFIMFAGVYFGGLFGDSTAGILLNTPGQSSAIASTFEGHRMARNVRAAVALATAAIGAFIGGLISTTIVVFFSPVLVRMATQFGPAEYFALAVFAFLAISSVVS